MLSPSHSITRCIDMLKRGDRAAAEALWDSYIHRLVALARARLGGMPRRAADEEDVALSAFDSFYRRAECGQFARLSDRDDLWQILVLITERKAIDLMRREGRQSRGEGRVVAFSEAEGQGRRRRRRPGPDARVRGAGRRRVPRALASAGRRLAPERRPGEDGRLHQQADRRAARLHRADGRAEAAIDPQDLVRGGVST